ncbi:MULTISPECIES: hypothetical protein [unclassified Arthrobacter]|uniref:hypothetical protein n=1 Tax=unclassified Arthrobacter TaxID=235627 RepID=UPI0011B03A16|nr:MULTISPECIES: hypothetical protein [unclassified Arthrobacter]
MENSRRWPLMVLALIAAMTLASCSLPMTPDSPEESSMGTSTSMMDQAGIKQIKNDGVGRFDLTATSVPKESVGLPANVNKVAYFATDTDKPVEITLELPEDTLTVSTSDFKMATAASNSYVDTVTWFEQVDGLEALDAAVAAAHERFGFASTQIAAWDAKNFMSDDSKGQQSLGMGVKNGTAIYLSVYWKKDSPVQVLQFSALVAPGYYQPEVQAEIAEFGRAPIGFKLAAQ